MLKIHKTVCFKLILLIGYPPVASYMNGLPRMAEQFLEV